MTSDPVTNLNIWQRPVSYNPCCPVHILTSGLFAYVSPVEAQLLSSLVLALYLLPCDRSVQAAHFHSPQQEFPLKPWTEVMLRLTQI